MFAAMIGSLMTPQERYLRIGFATLCIAMFVFLGLSNFWDWDVFLTYQEVDYRLWMVDRSLPLWSYQFCAGSTRIGDPQSLGLSPLFVWVLLFGPWWGTKLLVFFCWFLGFVFTRKLLVLLVQSCWHRDMQGVPVWIEFLALAWLCGNFFLWHLHAGHVTFAFVGLGLGLVYYTCKAWLQGLQTRDWFWGISLSFVYYTSGFYQSTLYFLLPLFFSLACVLGWQTWDKMSHTHSRKAWLKTLVQMVGFHAIGLGLASYKLYFVLAYQQSFPRKMVYTPEVGSIWNVWMSQLLPTWSQRYLGQWYPIQDHHYSIWEHSHFNVLVWLFLLVLVWELWMWLRGRWRTEETPLEPREPSKPEAVWILRWLVVYGVVVILFCFGDFASWSPHSLLNRWIFHHSIRVIWRYQIGLTFVVMLALALWFWSHAAWQKRLMGGLIWPLCLGVGFNLWTFSDSLSVEQFLFLQKTQVSRTEKMQWMILVPFRQGQLPPMYQAVRAGLGVINCYTPIALDHRPFLQELPQTRPHILYDGNVTTPQPRLRPFPLIDTKHTPVSASCLQGSYFTQSRIVLHPSCPRRVCVRIRQNNLYQRAEFSWDPKAGKYCRQ